MRRAGATGDATSSLPCSPSADGSAPPLHMPVSRAAAEERIFDGPTRDGVLLPSHSSARTSLSSPGGHCGEGRQAGSSASSGKGGRTTPNRSDAGGRTIGDEDELVTGGASLLPRRATGRKLGFEMHRRIEPRLCIFSSPLSSEAKCLPSMPLLLESKLMMHSVGGEA